MQNEVMEQKEKKPLSKKGKLVRILIVVLAALLLLGGGWCGGWFANEYLNKETPFVHGCFMKQDGKLTNCKIRLENIYIEGNELYYTVVNETGYNLCRQLCAPVHLAIYRGEEYVYPIKELFVTKDCWKYNPLHPDFLAHQSKPCSLGLSEELLKEGHYRIELQEYILVPPDDPYNNSKTISIIGTYDIPAAS